MIVTVSSDNENTSIVPVNSKTIMIAALSPANDNTSIVPVKQL